ncbi:EAL domain-containing protein [Kineococcus sp. LSe6-4]|uniref:EAL domain-containing protein n=1 Tax=Kineococcus halophytocola TaxID=3234027 RepID=A0ABV4H6M9_9ACTN
MSRPTPGPVVDFVAVAHRALRDLSQRAGLGSWWIGRTEGPDQVLLAVVDPVLGLAVGDALPWADTHCRRVVEQDAHPVALGLPRWPDSLAARVGARADTAVDVISVPLTAPDGRVLATLCGVGTGDGTRLPELLDSIRVQGDLLGALLAAELELADRTRAAARADLAGRADEVTGVATAQSWQEGLAQEEAHAARHAVPVSLVLLQVLGLGQVNTELGMPAGDALLHRAATAIGARLREGDLLARTGPDRFGLLLPGTGDGGAAALTERLRTALAAEGVTVRTGRATRSHTTTLFAAWSAAEDRLATDTPTSPGRTGVGQTGGGRAGLARPPAPRPAGGSALDALLDLARRQVGADIAFITTVEGERRVIRNVACPEVVPVAPGMPVVRGDGLCDRVLATGEAFVVPDLAVTHATSTVHRQGLRTYVGVPLRRRDGSLYGTLCALSREADPDLRPRDADVLEAVAGAVMELVEEEDGARRVRRARLARLADLDATGGPAVVYQPVVDLASGATVGAEALSRFPAGTPAPDRWFADATEVGAGQDLELAALDNAVRGLPHLPGFLALNVSPATITTPAFLRRLGSLPPERIVVEITEHSAVADYATLLRTLEPLRRNGLRIAVDDTGAGYASLSHVLAVLPDFIKLDISLVRSIDADTSRRALTAGLVTFAQATGAGIIAEGIETAAELAVLRDLGVGLGQGYHLARPAPLRITAA